MKNATKSPAKSGPKGDKLLSKEERTFCFEYLANGHNAYKAALAIGKSEEFALKSSHKLLKRANVKDYIEKQLAKVDEKLLVTYEWKIHKLRLVIERAIPEEGKERTVAPGVGITAIGELNRMQGHYSPDKIVTTNLNADTDIGTVKNVMDDIIEKYNKPY